VRGTEAILGWVAKSRKEVENEDRVHKKMLRKVHMEREEKKSGYSCRGTIV
jgi:hypothetical protein